MDTRAFPFHIKSLSTDGRIEGLISAFGRVDSYGDTVKRGAYAKSLAAITASGRHLPMLYQHDPHRPIGVWTELRETDEGLFGSAKLTMKAPDAQLAYALAEDGALTGISIGFEIAPGGATQNGAIRELSQIDLWEASIVTFPADTHARVRTIKSIAGVADIEDLLREGGLSGRRAKAAASAAWKAIHDSKDDDEAKAQATAILNASAARIRAIMGN